MMRNMDAGKRGHLGWSKNGEASARFHVRATPLGMMVVATLERASGSDLKFPHSASTSVDINDVAQTLRGSPDRDLAGAFFIPKTNTIEPMAERLKVRPVYSASNRIQGWAVERNNYELGFYKDRRVALREAQIIHLHLFGNR